MNLGREPKEVLDLILENQKKGIFLNIDNKIFLKKEKMINNLEMEIGRASCRERV